MQTNYKRDDESGKTIRNEVEIIILLYGQVVDYDYINSRFEISPKTFKRDMEGIKIAALLIIINLGLRDSGKSFIS